MERETTRLRVSSTESRRFQLLFVGGESGVTTFTLPESGEVTIGRSRDCTLRVTDAMLSRHHARLRVDDDGLCLEDLGSVNGTKASGRALAAGEAVRVSPGDVLSFGGVVALVESVNETSARVRRAVSIGVPTEALDEPASSGAPPKASRPSFKPVVARFESIIASVASTTLSVLVLGETGVGKEIVARAIHARSPRAKKPLLCLNCASIAESLLESELFGFEAGTFTGAVESRMGLLESAQGGTVLLDEIGELPLTLQAKLLRVIETREVQRLGARKPIALDVRFVAATHRDLEAEAAVGTFRSDLYFRLNGVTLHVPPLRERRDEIVPLAENFANDIAASLGRSFSGFSAEARQALLQHSWPGNVRELRNVIERAVLLGRDGAIDSKQLPCALPAGASERERRSSFMAARLAPEDANTLPGLPEAPPSSGAGPRTSSNGIEPLALSLDHDEQKRRVLAALEHCSGNQTRAARLLGVSRRTLISRLETYCVPRPRKTR